MQEFIDTLMTGLPQMFGHAAIIVALLVAGVLLYIKLTPYDDMKLVKEGNIASAISLFSIIVGLAIPLALCLAQVSAIADILFWGSFTVAIQLFAFKVCDWMLSDLSGRIERGEISAAIVLLAVKLAAALINSAMG
jgi:putative membrane protein